MTLSEELTWRGFVSQTTIEDLSQLDNKKVAFYHGFDASADSQTVGNLAGMMCDMVLMRHGHEAYILAGGSTSLIGDPGGKDSERPMQDEATIAHNVAQAEVQLKRIFTGQEFTLVNNLDWTKDMSVIEFLRDIGKHFSMSTLVSRDYIARRIGEGGGGISYTEFSYTLLQGMDFLHLFDKYGVTVQLGGSDQWGNCLSGVDLIRRARGAEAHVLAHPLVINKATGKKFGKTEAGAVWLDANKTSIFDFYQFWLNVDDEGAEEYLKVYTVLDKPEVEAVMQEFRQNPAGRVAQKRLAYEVTKIVHGENQADAAVEATAKLFDGGSSDLTPTVEIVPGTYPVFVVLVKAGLATSLSEARRLFEQGGVKHNQQKVTVPTLTIASGDLLQVGKRKFAKIV